MKNVMVLFFTVFLTTVFAHAYVVPLQRDLKPASQVMLEKQDFGTPAAASANAIKTTFAGATAATAITYSTFTAQPDVPRNVSLTPTGTTGDVESCVVTVNGTNYFGAAISETLTFAADASTIQSGSKAFKTVSSVVFPADCESGGFAATWTMGYGEKIGLKRCIDIAGTWAWSTVAGAYETTRATITADDNEIEKNVADFNGTMNGSNRFLGFFVQNFVCLP